MKRSRRLTLTVIWFIFSAAATTAIFISLIGGLRIPSFTQKQPEILDHLRSHIQNPNSTRSEFYQIAKAKGIVYTEVPDVYSKVIHVNLDGSRAGDVLELEYISDSIFSAFIQKSNGGRELMAIYCRR